MLLSDVDVVWMQNPFTLPSIYRDADVEVATYFTSSYNSSSSYNLQHCQLVCLASTQVATES